MCSCYLVLPNKIRRKGEILHKHTKDKSTEDGLLLRKILSHIILNPPYHQFLLDISILFFLEIFIRFDSDF